MKHLPPDATWKRVPSTGVFVSGPHPISVTADFEGTFDAVWFPSGEIKYVAHLEIANFTATTFRTLLKAWKAFRERTRDTDFYTIFRNDTPATHRFALLCGWTELPKPAVMNDGTTRRSYIHRAR